MINFKIALTALKKIFVASSAAAKTQAKKFIEGCSAGGVLFVPWWDNFTPGRTLLEGLDALRTEVDGAVLLLSQESNSEIRNRVQPIPNLNVLFEFGFFYGHFQKERVAIIRYGEVYLPSDLLGYVHIQGSKHFKRSGGVPVGKKTKNNFERWLNSW